MAIELDVFEQYTAALGRWLTGGAEELACEEHGEFACTSRACAPPPVGRGGSLPSGGAGGRAPTVEEAGNRERSSSPLRLEIEGELGTDDLSSKMVRVGAKEIVNERLTQALVKSPAFRAWVDRNMDRRFGEERDEFGDRFGNPAITVTRSLLDDDLLDLPIFRENLAKTNPTIRELLQESVDYLSQKSRSNPYLDMDEYEIVASILSKRMVDQWAFESNGTPDAMAYQLAAAKVHGIDAQKAYSNWPYATKQVMRATMKPLMESAEDVLKRFDGMHEILARVEYDVTQQWLKDNGISEVMVHRGVVTSENPIEWSLVDTTTAIDMNPLSSWSTSREEAEEFATRAGGRASGAVFSMRVPASMIQSIPLTGRGCLDEDEVVLVGFPNSEALIADVSGAGRMLDA